jgi:hypothetical protein
VTIYAQSGKIDGLYYNMAKCHLVAVNKEFSMIFRISQKLAKKLGEGELPSLPLDENPYDDWSAHLFTVARTQYIIVANTRALYSVVMYGKGITNDSQFIDRALSSLREFMKDDGQSFVYQRFIAPASGSVQFAKALDRSVTGSINELLKFATAWLEDGEVLPHDVGFKLNDIILSALAPSKKDGYGKPNDAFRALAGRLGSRASGEV